MPDATRMYPDDCVQNYVSPWWVEDRSSTVIRGRLLWTWVPYPEMKPYRLVPEGRGDDPRQHGRAQFRIETFRMGDPPKGIATLPVAALPMRDGETYLVQRGKRRPAVVIGAGGVAVSTELRAGREHWQSARSILVAPFYGAAPNSSRGGWPEPFVDRIRHVEYPQYVWDVLPLSVSTASMSILRLDHLFAVGADPANWQTEPYVLGPDALGVIDDWTGWLLAGRLPADSALAYLRAELPSV
jgi:hypothetical protein